MILSDLIQGSDDWLEVRKNKITSSDASVINGTNKFRGNNPLKLWRQKLDLEDVEYSNAAMQEGNILELEARDWFNKNNNTNFHPQVIFHEEKDWIMASLDGYDENSEYILEIKCGEATYDKATKGLVPPYYFDQIQHQLYASGKQQCYYLAYRPDKEPITIVIERDEQFLEALIDKEFEFYEYLKTQVPPPFTEKDYIELIEEEAVQKGIKWALAKMNAAKYIEEEKRAREELFEQTDDGNCIIPEAGVKIQRVVKPGNIDYKQLLKDLNITDEVLEKYRKNEVSYLLPSLLKIKEA